MTAFNADDGSVAWRYDTFSALRDVAPGTSGFVYLSTDDGALHALGSDSGSLIWLFQPDARGAGSIISADEQQVVFKTQRGELFALQADSGALLWWHLP